MPTQIYATTKHSDTLTPTQPIPSQSVQKEVDVVADVSSDVALPLDILSTQLLQSSVADRETERERRRQNGNVPLREDKTGGKNLDKTCLRLAIERPGRTGGGRATTHYFCIVCDKFRANNSRSRAFEHADQCDVSIKSPTNPELSLFH